MKEIFSAIVACFMAVGIIYVIDVFIVHIGGTATDRDVIVALEVAAVAVLIAFVIGKEVLEILANVLRLMKGQETESGSIANKMGLIFATIIASLGVYFGFVKYVVPL